MVCAPHLMGLNSITLNQQSAGVCWIIVGLELFFLLLYLHNMDLTDTWGLI